MTKQDSKVPAILGLAEEIASGKATVRYAPMQTGDTLVGTASAFALKTAAFINKLQCSGEITETRLRYETDAVQRQNYMEEMLAIATRLSIAVPLLELQLRSDTGVWNEKLTIRADGQVVVTESDKQMGEAIRSQMNDSLDDEIQNRLAGASPRRSRVRVLNFGKLDGEDILNGGFDLGNLDELIPGLSQILQQVGERQRQAA